jgi:hypothetical protein
VQSVAGATLVLMHLLPLFGGPVNAFVDVVPIAVLLRTTAEPAAPGLHVSVIGQSAFCTHRLRQKPEPGVTQTGGIVGVGVPPGVGVSPGGGVGVWAGCGGCPFGHTQTPLPPQSGLLVHPQR